MACDRLLGYWERVGYLDMGRCRGTCRWRPQILHPGCNFARHAAIAIGLLGICSGQQLGRRSFHR